MKERIQGFLHFLEAEKGYAENTIAAYQNDLNQFYQHILTNEDKLESWAEVKKDIIVNYIERLKTGEEYASSTVARKVAAIKSFFHFIYSQSFFNTDK